MNKVSITSGQKYTDIDALACAFAYCKLLNLQGVDSAVYLAKFNQSIPSKFKAFDLDVFSINDIKPESKVVIVDISDPNYLPKNVEVKNVIRVFDHHTGFESFWRDKIGGESKIEFIGSCATLIFEEWEKSGFISNLDTVSANLLSLAIISNTLNFKAGVTHDRDVSAFSKLKKYTSLPNSWISDYFKEIQQTSISDPKKSLKNDTKEIKIDGKHFVISQLELWEAKDFLLKNTQLIKNIFTKVEPNTYWFYTSPSIKEGVNYIFTEDIRTQGLIKKILNVTFVNGIAVTQKLYLRKEIIKLIQNL